MCERRGLDHHTLHREAAGREKLCDLTMKGTQPQVMRNRLWLGVQIDDVLGHGALHSTRGVIYNLISRMSIPEIEMEPSRPALGAVRLAGLKVRKLARLQGPLS